MVTPDFMEPEAYRILGVLVKKTVQKYLLFADFIKLYDYVNTLPGLEFN